MKNIKKIAIIVFVFFYINTFSQNIKQWNTGVYNENYNLPPFPPKWKNQIFKTIGDTTINKIKYQKIYKDTNENFENPIYVSSYRNSGDTILMHIEGKDEVFYNFKLNKSDSIFIYKKLSKQIYAKIDSVINININNQVLRKLYVSYYKKCSEQSSIIVSKDIWIENIGSMKSGLFHSVETCATGVNTKTHLICFTYNGKKIYQNSDFKDCLVKVGTKENKSIKTTIFPNPVSDELKFKSNHHHTKNITISLFDSYGNLLFAQKGFADIDMRNYGAGLYFVKIADSFKTIETIKFVKQ